MTDQTKKMCKSMPLLAKWLEDFDAKGHEWVIVSWRNIPPWRVTLDQVTPLPVVQIGMQTIPNLFTSRTSALRQSEASCHHVTHLVTMSHIAAKKSTGVSGLGMTNMEGITSPLYLQQPSNWQKRERTWPENTGESRRLTLRTAKETI